MEHVRTAELCNVDLSVAFYEQRYAGEYMDEWPADKIDKVREVIARADLPPYGKVLDFGCGTGVFTAVLADALPGWEIYGADVSGKAISKAKQRVPQARFFLIDDRAFDALRVDFAFSHHVLEHVPDLGTARDKLLKYLAPAARMLHVLPCGNKGSLSHSLSRMRKDGIDPRLGNRFFFEDVGHVRRLTTDEMVNLFRDSRFSLLQSYYTGQRWGTIDYFTRIEPHLIDTITDSKQAVDPIACAYLKLVRGAFRLILGTRIFVRKYENKLKVHSRGVRDRCMLSLAWAPYLFARSIQVRVEALAQAEWDSRKYDPRGDQMFLLFGRDAAGQASDVMT